MFFKILKKFPKIFYNIYTPKINFTLWKGYISTRSKSDGKRLETWLKWFNFFRFFSFLPGFDIYFIYSRVLGWGLALFSEPPVSRRALGGGLPGVYWGWHWRIWPQVREAIVGRGCAGFGVPFDRPPFPNMGFLIGPRTFFQKHPRNVVKLILSTKNFSSKNRLWPMFFIQIFFQNFLLKFNYYRFESENWDNIYET